MNKTGLEQLADLRLAEAVALLGLMPPMPDAAYYLAGYAVECALKACIAKLTDRHDFPDKNFAAKCFTHKAKELVPLGVCPNNSPSRAGNDGSVRSGRRFSL